MWLILQQNLPYKIIISLMKIEALDLPLSYRSVMYWAISGLSGKSTAAPTQYQEQIQRTPLIIYLENICKTSKKRCTQMQDSS